MSTRYWWIFIKEKCCLEVFNEALSRRTGSTVDVVHSVMPCQFWRTLQDYSSSTMIMVRCREGKTNPWTHRSLTSATLWASREGDVYRQIYDYELMILKIWKDVKKTLTFQRRKKNQNDLHLLSMYMYSCMLVSVCVCISSQDPVWCGMRQAF